MNDFRQSGRLETGAHADPTPAPQHRIPLAITVMAAQQIFRRDENPAVLAQHRHRIRDPSIDDHERTNGLAIASVQVAITAEGTGFGLILGIDVQARHFDPAVDPRRHRPFGSIGRIIDAWVGRRFEAMPRKGANIGRWATAFLCQTYFFVWQTDFR